MAVAAVCIDRKHGRTIVVLVLLRIGNTAFLTFLDMLCALIPCVVELLVIGEFSHDIVSDGWNESHEVDSPSRTSRRIWR